MRSRLGFFPRLETRQYRFGDDPMSIEEAWRRYGTEATAAHVAVYPGSRPALWFRYGLPGDDGGGGDKAA